jgi:hypothetical protein
MTEQMKPDGEYPPGIDERSFAEAARKAVENAEQEIRERDPDAKLPELYDVRLQVGATGPLSDYRVFVTPAG